MTYEWLDNVKSSFELITPKRAAALIKLMHPRQRKLSERAVDKYADDMSNGYFIPTHQGIMIFDDGLIGDGNTRLHAIIKSNTPTVVQVSTGWPTEIEVNGELISFFDFLDQGRPRSVAQIMQTAHDMKDSNRVVSVCNKILTIARDSSYSSGTTQQIKFILDLFGDDITQVLSEFRGHHRGAFWTVPAVLIKEGDPELYDKYRCALVDGFRPYPHHPVHALESWANSHPVEVRRSCRASIAVAGSALAKLKKDQSVRKLYGGSSMYEWLCSNSSGRLAKVRSIFN